MSRVICLLRDLFGARKCIQVDCDQSVFTLTQNGLVCRWFVIAAKPFTPPMGMREKREKALLPLILLIFSAYLPQVAQAVTRVPSTELVCYPYLYPGEITYRCALLEQGAEHCASFGADFSPNGECYSSAWNASIAQCVVTCDDALLPVPPPFPLPPIIFPLSFSFDWLCPAGMDFNYNSPSTFAYCYSIEPVPEVRIGDTDKNLGCNGNEGATVGNPCNPATGNKYLVEQDIETAAFSALQFRRYYNSLDARFSGIGFGWMSSFSRALEVTQQSILYRDETGRGYRFTKSGSQWVTAADVYATLVQDGTGYTLTTPGQVTERFSTSGKLQSITDSRGVTQTITYDLLGHIDRAESSTGQYLEFTYDVSNRIETMTDQASRVWRYRYDAISNLEYVDNPDYTTKRYHYEQTNFPHVLTGITDERGIRYATYDYDDQGRVNLSTHAGDAQKVTINYNPQGQPAGSRIITNSRDQASTYSTLVQLDVALITNITGPGCSTCGSGNTSYTYDPLNNNLLSKTANNVTTQYGDYDDKGQVGYKIEAVGTAEERRTDYTYDARFYHKIATLTEPSVAASQSKVTTYTYDDWGNRLSETINGFKPDGTAVSRTTAYQYTGPLHQLSQIDGPRTDVSDITTYAYFADDAAEGNNRARLQRVTDASGVALRDNIQYTATGKVQSETRPNGLTVSYTYYPGNDRLETLTESDGTSSRVTRWTYLLTGEVEAITLGYGTSDAVILSFGYDDARRLTRLTDGLGNYIEYTLDTEGNREYERIYDSTGSLKKQLAQTFDTYSRLDSTAQANETTNPNFAPDGTLDNTTDGKGSITDYSYDALKRLTSSVQNQGGSDVTTKDATTGYVYDTADRLRTVTDPVNGNTTYVYNDLGTLLSQASPDSGTATFSYDSAGNLKTKTDAKAQVLTYSYDVLNRLTLIDGVSTADDISYSYDTCTKGVGRLCSATRVSETAAYAYDAFGGVTAHQTMSYVYDAVGRIKEQTYPGGAKVVYSRNAAGQINRVELHRNGTVTTVFSGATYHPFGLVAAGLFGNGQSLSVAVDVAYRSGARTSGTYSQVIDAATGYDANGNLLAYTGTESPVFGYDALDRLATANATSFGSRGYDYDKNGNRTQLTAGSATTSYAYTTNSNRLSNLGGAAVTLDVNGNTTAQGTGSYTYDRHNRLTKAYAGGVLKATYTYNGLGQRVKKVIAGGGTIRYVYGLNGELLAETTNTGAVQCIYIYLENMPLAVLIGTALYYIHTDHLGTPKALTNTTGTKTLWTATHDPFGKATVNEDADGNGQPTTFNLRFPGQYYDAETGLHYNYFRTYDPGTGRYLESDPIGLRGGLNTYTYVYNNPLRYVDPFGLTAEDIVRLTNLTRQTQPDLNVPNRVGTGPLAGDGSAITNPLTLGVTVDNYYLNELNTQQRQQLLETIIHESIHRTNPRSDMIKRPFDHPDIYDEAERRRREVDKNVCY